MRQVSSFWVKSKRNKTHESLGSILQLPKLYQMVHAVFVRFNVTIKHRRVCVNPASMNLFRELQPTLAGGFVRTNPAPGRLAKNLSTSAGTAVQSRGDQTINDFIVRHPA